MAETNLNYVALVDRVIRDYNAIFNTLQLKDTALEGTVVPTDQYATHIDKLTYIVPSSGTHKAPDTVTGIFTGSQSFTLDASEGVVRDANKFTIKGKFTQDYYIDSDAFVTTTISGGSFIKDLNLTGDLEALNATNYSPVLNNGVYTITPDHIVGSITVKKGTVSTVETKTTEDSSGIELSKTLTNALTVETKDDDDTRTTVSILDSGKTSAYAIGVKAKADLTGLTVSSTTTTTVTEGYVNDRTFNTTVDKTFSDSSANDETLIYLPQGGVSVSSTSGDSNTASANITSEDGYDVFVAENDNTTPSITLSASVVGNFGLKVDYTEGYVKGSQNLDKVNISVSDADFKLKKATAKASNVFTPVIEYVSSDTSAIATASDEDTIDITVNTAKQENLANTTVTDGFLTATDLANSKITIDSAADEVIKVKKAKGLVAKAGITGYTVGGDAITTSATSDVYTITVTPTLSKVSVDGSATGARFGYVSDASEISSSNTTATAFETKEIKIAQGKVTNSAPVISLSVQNAEDDKLHDITGTGSIVNLFTTTAPSEGDYLKLNTTAISTLTAGYIETGTVSQSSADYYLPKAEFSWIAVGEDGEEALQVSKGGYVPSGVITEIANVDLTGYNASVEITSLSNSIAVGAIPSDADEDDFYKLTITPTINAGYISAGNASSVLKNLDWYVAKGKATATADLTFDTPSGVEYDTTEKSYAITIKATGTADFGEGAVAGYIDDVTTLTAAATSEKTAKIKLATATFNETTHTTNIKNTAAATLTGYSATETDTSNPYKDSEYVITPGIDSCSVAFSVSSAGWITNDDKDNLKFETTKVHHSGNHEKFYIKPGDYAKANITNANFAGVTANIEDGKITGAASGGVYTISLGGSLTAKIDLTTADGYYGATETGALAGVAKTINVTGSSFNINKASVALDATPTAATISSTDVTLYASNADANDPKAKFAKIESSGSVTTEVSTFSEGYIKAASEVVTTDATSVEVKGDKYIKLFETTDKQYTDKTTYDFTVGNDDADATLVDLSASAATDNTLEISTAGKYMSKDTTVTLNSHAMGTDVLAKLIMLEERLAGVKHLS